MTLGEINTKITELTGYDTNRYSNANRIINIQTWIDKLATMVVESMDEDDYDDPNHGDFPILTTNLVASQQDYAFPSQLVDIQRMEAKLDGSNWYKVEPLDIAQLGDPTDTTSIANNFSTSQPYYDMRYGSFFLYPIPQSNVTSGLKVWITRAPKAFTSSDLSTGTATPGFARAFHPMLAYGAAFERLIMDNPKKAKDYMEVLQDYEVRLKKHYGKRNKDRTYALGAAIVDYD